MPVPLSTNFVRRYSIPWSHDMKQVQGVRVARKTNTPCSCKARPVSVAGNTVLVPKRKGRVGQKVPHGEDRSQQCVPDKMARRLACEAEAREPGSVEASGDSVLLSAVLERQTLPAWSHPETRTGDRERL
ncbi:hypothetical protein AXG93_4875s1130 [Marchantia polymorpha subsp. ruderalis]|uniref:Uncharacterized protein n=1 Tax=Marchantia polymorpha subsp. ruderalis TaxID=1480154 RepID=A0A176WNG2_MARPO|nr:hypothetical protein AXG93_4875s1130 [Marchantia polymorpha subsp. ruderalis]